MALMLEKLKKELEENVARSVEVAKALEDLELHKLRMKRLAEELSVAEAWEIELKTRRWRIEESLKPPLLGLFDKLESRASRVRQLERKALLMFVDLLLRLRFMLNEDIGLGRVKKLAKMVVRELARPDIVWSCLDNEEVRVVVMMTQEMGGVLLFLARVVNQLLAGAARKR